MVRSVLPAALTVSNMERSLAFYCGLLGFRIANQLPKPAERERWDEYHGKVCCISGARIRVIYLEAPDGATHLELIEYLKPKASAPKRRRLNDPGTTIVALEPENSQRAVERLRAAQVEIVSDPVPYETDEGERSLTTYFYDPDGNALCLFEILGGARKNISGLDPKDSIRKNFEAFNNHDIEGVVLTYTEDCELIDITQRDPVYGHDMLRKYAEKLFQVFPDIHIENAYMISEGNTVAAKFKLVGTHKGEFLGYEGTNKIIHWPTCSFFELAESDDRIKRETYYYDRGSLVEQLRG